MDQTAARYSRTGNSQILATANVDINSRTFTASSLTPATSYTFQVAYTNAVGMGPFADLIIQTLGYERKASIY